MKVCAWLVAGGFLLLVACSSVHTHRDPRADLSHLKRFYVEHRLNDNNRIDAAIVAELKSLGFDASAGPLTMMPDATDALVNYEDVWAWDFKSYLLQLNIVIRHPHVESRTFAAGTYRQPTVVTKSPPEVVREILKPLFPQVSATRVQ